MAVGAARGISPTAPKRRLSPSGECHVQLIPSSRQRPGRRAAGRSPGRPAVPRARQRPRPVQEQCAGGGRHRQVLQAAHRAEHQLRGRAQRPPRARAQADAARRGLYCAPGCQINAWDNEDFVKAVKATGRKQLIIAGVVTEVCVAFPALSALAEGFEVFVVTDASGTFNEVTRNAAWNRMSEAGAQLMTWFGLACELHRDWRNDVQGLGTLFANHIPDYRNLMTSYSAIKASK